MGLGAGIILLAVGAVLTFAVNVSTSGSGIDLHTIGVILMVVGGLGILLSMIFWSSWGGFGGRRDVAVADGAVTRTTTTTPVVTRTTTIDEI